LKEFLEVMQPASKAKKWVTEAGDDDTNEPPSKIQAIEVPEAESDNKYESVPKKTRESSPPKPASPVPDPTQAVKETPAAEDEPIVDISAINATDDDWLRSRTNRLLDLMDPEDIAPAQTANVEVVTAADESTVDEEKPAEEQDEVVVEEEEKTDPVLEAISANGRLFVRNLPYTATEEDLRKYFEPYGSLEEVCIFPFLLPFLSCHCDEYPDRDSLCYEHLMRTGRLF
jgi:multiple RNA-binding domain-containing protein 1